MAGKTASDGDRDKLTSVLSGPCKGLVSTLCFFVPRPGLCAPAKSEPCVIAKNAAESSLICMCFGSDSDGDALPGTSQRQSDHY